MNKICECRLSRCRRKFLANVKWVGKFCCRKHYREYARTEGTILRFWKRVKVRSKDECWEWIGRVDKHGYGRIEREGTDVLASRIAMEIKLGRSLTSKECSLHSCDNPACVNPKHLWLGSQGDNMKDMVKKGRSSRLPGESNGKSRFKTQEILRMRKLFDSGKRIIEIAREYKTAQPVINRIVHRKRWKHI